MGIIIGEKNVTLEKKVKGIYIQRSSDLKTLYVTIRGSRGFYDEDNNWNELNEFDVVLQGDEILFLMNLSSSKLRTNKIGEMIYKAAYGILSGAISLKCTLNVISNVSGTVKIYKNGINIYQMPTNTPFVLPVLVNATISVESPGYKTYTTTVPVLQGEVTLNVNLEPNETEEPEEVNPSTNEDSDSGAPPEEDSGNSSEEDSTIPSEGDSEDGDTTAPSDDNSDSESEGTSTP
jgi:cellobiose-specific phosphotransferase system component IIB